DLHDLEKSGLCKDKKERKNAKQQIEELKGHARFSFCIVNCGAIVAGCGSIFFLAVSYLSFNARKPGNSIEASENVPDNETFCFWIVGAGDMSDEDIRGMVLDLAEELWHFVPFIVWTLQLQLIVTRWLEMMKVSGQDCEQLEKLLGISLNPESYAWLRQTGKPSGPEPVAAPEKPSGPEPVPAPPSELVAAPVEAPDA
ncbi:unnamed protein product, partial [Symbiodinium sp. KB8]